MHWLIDPITKHYVDFRGRASRQEYWMFALFLFVLYIGIVLVFFTLSEKIMLVVLVGTMIASALPSISIQVRRLHDIGWSGWWILLSFLPYAGGLVLLVLYCLPSQVGTNKYGTHPYGVETLAQPSSVSEAVKVQDTTGVPPEMK